jgi:V-type H+-transporting ATPase proteolipid subunit
MTYAQCVRAYVHESKVFVAMVLILIFAEVLGLYGFVLPLFHEHE